VRANKESHPKSSRDAIAIAALTGLRHTRTPTLAKAEICGGHPVGRKSEILPSS
jgi:hypothetical protein